ncbi:hypothetical protein, partial [Mesorhizobium sp.]|uniref:hypothetical protein n=1 Tax=Mesorhizobium sp. TaxID=1871066 RepID=UPI0025BB4735
EHRAIGNTRKNRQRHDEAKQSRHSNFARLVVLRFQSPVPLWDAKLGNSRTKDSGRRRFLPERLRTRSCTRA